MSDGPDDTAEPVGTHFGDAVTASSIYTGTGHVYNIYASGYESVMSRLGGPRLTFKGDLGWSEQRFVAPPGLDAVRHALRRHGTAILTGPPGSGRSTAAKVLVNESSGDDTPYSLLTDEPYDLDNRLSGVEPLADHRLVLDLLESSEEIVRTRLRELPEFRTRLVNAHASLVIVLPDEFAPLLPDELRQFTERIGVPAGKRVLRRHLEAEGHYPTDDHLSSEGLAAVLDSSMAEIAALADRVTEMGRHAPECPLDILLADAVSEHADLEEEAAKLVEQRPGGRERAILLASAMCHEASGDAVFFASHRLVELLSLNDSERPRLEQSGYRTQLSDLGIGVSEAESVVLGKRHFDRALLEHFWDNYPDLRQTFCLWVNEVIRLDPLTGADRLRMVDRFTEQALRTSSLGQLEWLIERWIEPRSHGSRPLRDFGVQALTNGLEDFRHGRRFRRLVYDWSKDPGLPDEVGQILVTVTVELIAPNYPDQAVVRLHHRARRESGAGAPSAQQALLNLTSGSDFLLRLLLQRLERGFQRSEPWGVDFVLFARVADPMRLVDGERVSRPPVSRPDVRASLIAGWHALLAHRPDYARYLLERWLTAAERVPNADLLLTVPVEAARHSVELLAALYVTGRDWGRTAHDRPRVANRLAELIDLAQGLQNQDYAYPRPEEFVR